MVRLNEDESLERDARHRQCRQLPDFPCQPDVHSTGQ